MTHNHQDSTISKSSKVRFTHHIYTWLIAMQKEQDQNFSYTEWPVLLAGDGFKHGQHLAFDRKDNCPLTNLYVQMLQRVGLEYRTFATSTAESVPGFEMA